MCMILTTGKHDGNAFSGWFKGWCECDKCPDMVKMEKELKKEYAKAQKKLEEEKMKKKDEEYSYEELFQFTMDLQTFDDTMDVSARYSNKLLVNAVSHPFDTSRHCLFSIYTPLLKAANTTLGRHVVLIGCTLISPLECPYPLILSISVQDALSQKLPATQPLNEAHTHTQAHAWTDMP